MKARLDRGAVGVAAVVGAGVGVVANLGAVQDAVAAQLAAGALDRAGVAALDRAAIEQTAVAGNAIAKRESTSCTRAPRKLASGEAPSGGSGSSFRMRRAYVA